jgi:hypothetical protein
MSPTEARAKFAKLSHKDWYYCLCTCCVAKREVKRGEEAQPVWAIMAEQL